MPPYYLSILPSSREKKKKKKEKLNKEKVFSSDSGEDELVDMDEHELFV